MKRTHTFSSSISALLTMAFFLFMATESFADNKKNVHRKTVKSKSSYSSKKPSKSSPAKKSTRASSNEKSWKAAEKRLPAKKTSGLGNSSGDKVHKRHVKPPSHQKRSSSKKVHSYNKKNGAKVLNKRTHTIERNHKSRGQVIVSHGSKHNSRHDKKIKVYRPHKPKIARHHKRNWHDDGKYHPIHHGRNKYYYRHGRFHRRHHNHYIPIAAPFGALVLGIPLGHLEINIGLHTYYYYEGIYYERHHSRYRVVRPPIGVYLSFLPHGHQVVYASGNVYFELNGIYYRRWDSGYITCEPPHLINQPLEERDSENQTVTIIVENSNGSRTPVTLEKVGEYQYKGERGEYYDGLPTEEQLRLAYGF